MMGPRVSTATTFLILPKRLCSLFYFRYSRMAKSEIGSDLFFNIFTISSSYSSATSDEAHSELSSASKMLLDLDSSV